MASTSTNKQPMLIDRVLHVVADLKNRTVSSTAGIEIGGTNDALLLVDATTSDGCIIEEVYSYSRGTDYTINLYLSSAADYLRPTQGIYIGTFDCTATNLARATWDNAPKVLAPVPGANTSSGLQQFQALYIPKGKALWAAVVASNATDAADAAPLIGVQGGLF